MMKIPQIFLPTISVVMPVYNSANYLRESINSIINQKYKNFEFIIINDGSTDKSDEIINSIKDERIVYINNNNNLGNYVARNMGCKLARGKYLAVMDADDIAHHERLEQQYLFMEGNPNILAHGSYFVTNNIVYQKPTDNETLRVHLIFDNMFLHPSIMMRRTCFEHVSGYDETYYYSSDYHLMSKIALLGDIANIPQPLMNYRIHQNQISISKFRQQIGYANQIRIDYLFRCGFLLSEEEELLLTKIRHRIVLTKEEYSLKHKLINALIQQNRCLSIFNSEIFNFFLEKHNWK